MQFLIAFVLVELVACGPPPVRPRVSDHPGASVDPAERVLADGAEVPARRTRIARTGPARWSGSGSEIQLGTGATNPGADGELRSFPAVPVVEESRDHVRVLLDDDSVRAVAWIARAALYRVPVTRMTILRGPGTGDTRGIVLQPGTVIDVQELRADGRRHIRSAGKAVAFDAWIDDRLGETFVAGAEGPAEVHADGTVAAGTAVLAEVGQPPIATLQATEVSYEPGATPPAGYVSIVWTRTGIAVHGLVAAAAFTAGTQPTRWYLEDIAGGAAGMTDTPYATLRAGADLYDGPGGHRVGRVKRAMTIYGWGERGHGEWSQALIPIPQLGLVKTFVRTADLAAGFQDGGNG